jgi:hypothetical protein
VRNDDPSPFLLRRLAPKANIAEVSSTYVDHATILAHPMGLERLSEILVKLGAGYSSTWNKLLTHAAAWATP